MKVLNNCAIRIENRVSKEKVENGVKTGGKEYQVFCLYDDYGHKFDIGFANKQTLGYMAFEGFKFDEV